MLQIDTVLLGLLFAAVSTFLGVLVYRRTAKKDQLEEGANSGIILTQVAHIRGTVEDISRKLDEQNKINIAFAERIAKVEAASAQAHKRLDSLVGRVDDCHRGSGVNS